MVAFDFFHNNHDVKKKLYLITPISLNTKIWILQSYILNHEIFLYTQTSITIAFHNLSAFPVFKNHISS